MPPVVLFAVLMYVVMESGCSGRSSSTHMQVVTDPVGTITGSIAQSDLDPLNKSQPLVGRVERLHSDFRIITYNVLSPGIVASEIAKAFIEEGTVMDPDQVVQFAPGSSGSPKKLWPLPKGGPYGSDSGFEPADLDPILRFDKLVSQLNSMSDGRTVFALQEVDSVWASWLLKFFADHKDFGSTDRVLFQGWNSPTKTPEETKRDYEKAYYCLHNHAWIWQPFSRGLLLAVPVALGPGKFSSIDVEDIAREFVPPEELEKVVKITTGRQVLVWQGIQGAGPWVTIANYHNPLSFKGDDVRKYVLAHLAVIKSVLLKMRQSDGASSGAGPLVLVGDFNAQPRDEFWDERKEHVKVPCVIYNYLTGLQGDHKDMESMPADFFAELFGAVLAHWQIPHIDTQPWNLKSACRAREKYITDRGRVGEPEFTNYDVTDKGSKEMGQGGGARGRQMTLDYIFVSEDVRVADTHVSWPSDDLWEAAGVWPKYGTERLSDHMPIMAKLEIIETY